MTGGGSTVVGFAPLPQFPVLLTRRIGWGRFREREEREISARVKARSTRTLLWITSFRGSMGMGDKAGVIAKC